MDQPSIITRGINAGKEQTELYKVCFAKLPEHRKSVKNLDKSDWNGLDIDKISKEIGVSKQKVSSWFKNNELPGQRVKALMGLEGSLLTFIDLGPFLTSR